MPRVAKRTPPAIKGLAYQRLYHGTSEQLAKLAPHQGIAPYDVKEDADADRTFSDTKHDLVYLSDVYPGQMAYAHSNSKERWGIIEIDVSALDLSLLLPAEDALSTPVRKPKDPRRRIFRSKMRWDRSVATCGLCVYNGTIPANAVRRVAIYNPFSNWLVTKSVLHIRLNKGVHHTKNLQHNRTITRWLTAEGVTSEDWLGNKYAVTPPKEKEEVMTALLERSGLDIFYHGS